MNSSRYSGVDAYVGRTPLLRLRRLSELTGCEILGKAEFMNPGGSIKDRAALGIILDAEARQASILPARCASPGKAVRARSSSPSCAIQATATCRGSSTLNGCVSMALTQIFPFREPSLFLFLFLILFL
jgi:hypothetical protein